MMKSKICILLAFLVSSVVQGSLTVRAITSVSHLTHHGRETRKLAYTSMLDHTYYLELVNQAQPTARPNCNEFMGVLSREKFQRITSLMQTPTFQSLRTPQAFVQAGRSEAPHRIASSDPPTLSPTPFTCPLKPTLQPTNRESRIQNP